MTEPPQKFLLPLKVVKVKIIIKLLFSRFIINPVTVVLCRKWKNSIRSCFCCFLKCSLPLYHGWTIFVINGFKCKLVEIILFLPQFSIIWKCNICNLLEKFVQRNNVQIKQFCIENTNYSNFKRTIFVCRENICL